MIYVLSGSCLAVCWGHVAYGYGCVLEVGVLVVHSAYRSGTLRIARAVNRLRFAHFSSFTLDSPL